MGEVSLVGCSLGCSLGGNCIGFQNTKAINDTLNVVRLLVEVRSCRFPPSGTGLNRYGILVAMPRFLSCTMELCAIAWDLVLSSVIVDGTTPGVVSESCGIIGTVCDTATPFWLWWLSTT